MANIPLIFNVIFIEIFAILSIVFLILGEDKVEHEKRYDLFHYDSGVNLHSLLMLVGLVIMAGNSMILFRVFRDTRTKSLKMIHAILHAAGIVLAIIGFIAIYRSKKKTKDEIPEYGHFHTIHSWFGLYSTLMAIIQFVIGFTVYLSVYVSWEVQDEYAYVHAFVGVASLLLDTVICCLGLAFLSSYNIPEIVTGANCKTDHEGSLAYSNLSGLFTILFTGFVFYILVNPHNEWERVGEM